MLTLIYQCNNYSIYLYNCIKYEYVETYTQGCTGRSGDRKFFEELERFFWARSLWLNHIRLLKKMYLCSSI